MLVYFVVPKPVPGQPPQPLSPDQLPLVFGTVLVLGVAMFAVYALALRWTLKTRWSDFHLIAVETEKSESLTATP